MRALVLDEAFDLAPHVSRFMAGRSVEATVVCSPYEFEMAAASRGPFDLRVINLGGHVSAWEMARQLKSTDPAGPTLVLFDERGAQGLEHLVLPAAGQLRQTPGHTRRPRCARGAHHPGGEPLARAAARGFSPAD